LARPDLLTELVRLRDYTTLYLSPLVELIAERAIRAGDNLLRIRLEQARQNLRLLDDWVEQNHDYVEWVRPKGGVTAFLRLCDVPDVDAFCHRLVQSDGVLLVPGSCFNRPQHVRLGFGGPASELKEGLARLSTRLRARFT
jgi:aspartate/methionine/tyrosine aminotransferase